MARIRGWVAAALAVGGLASAQETPPGQPAPGPEPVTSAEDLRAQREWETALSLVQKKFLRPMTREQLERRALALLLHDLDPYSNYLSPSALADFQGRLDSGYVGIGVQMDQDPQLKLPRIANVIAGSPADRGGVRRGDRLVAIDGQALKDKPADGVGDLLRGPPDTAVAVRVLRAQGGVEEDLALLRQRVVTPSVRGLRRRADGSQDYLVDTARHIGYVRISRLARDTAPTLERALAQLRAEHARGLVLDLRDCTGGLMNAALAAADQFVDQGKLLSVLERGQERDYTAEPGTRWEGPLVVLVNEETVSSGEILAGALKDSGQARLVGSRTYGKGRIQVLYRLGEGMGGVMISTGTFKRPNGQTLDKHDVPEGSDAAGIRPDPGDEVRVEKAERQALQAFQQRLDDNVVVTEAERSAAPRDRELEHALALLLAQPPAAALR